MLFKYTDKELDLLARLMRAEALGEGDLGMLMVGNVVSNRIIGDCLDFLNIRSVTDAIYQANQFAGTKSPLFYGSSTTLEKNLANRVLRGDTFFPSTHALWFYTPGTEPCKTLWYNQQLSGKYKNHCFYVPGFGICKQIR